MATIQGMDRETEKVPTSGTVARATRTAERIKIIIRLIFKTRSFGRVFEAGGKSPAHAKSNNYVVDGERTLKVGHMMLSTGHYFFI
ncbi:MAG: hypothetical protein UY15_C0021G0019 [Parcubacteria group bacterium GW2011_GWA2_47_9]|nr:MAG: hypothetical protein UY15_C0021G0019 [Parcubacteria group bacterium GW2011_GWA2_47_9]